MRPEGVCAHDALHLGGVRIGHALPAAGDARVVDEDVDVPEVGEHLLDHRLVLVPVLDGRRVGLRRAPKLLDCGDGVPRGLLVAPVVHRDGRPVFGQRQRDRPADAAAASSNQRNAPSK